MIYDFSINDLCVVVNHKSEIINPYPSLRMASIAVILTALRAGK